MIRYCFKCHSSNIGINGFCKTWNKPLLECFNCGWKTAVCPGNVMIETRT